MLKKTKPTYTPFQPTLTAEGQALFDVHVALKRPSLCLSSFIYAFVQVRTRSQTVYPVIPDGTNILFFSQCKETFGGTQKSILEVPLNTEHAEYFGIWFYPGTVRSFFNIDLSDVTNDLIGLNFLEDANWLFLNEQLAECVGLDQLSLQARRVMSSFYNP